MPIQKDLTCPQGTSFEAQVGIKLSNQDGSPINLTGYTATFHARKSYDSQVIEIKCTTEDKTLMLTPDSGKMNIYIDPEISNAIFFKGESVDYVYDLDVTSPIGKVTRIMQGTLTITKNV